MKLFTLASATLKMSAWRFHSPPSPHIHTHSHNTHTQSVFVCFCHLFPSTRPRAIRQFTSKSSVETGDVKQKWWGAGSALHWKILSNKSGGERKFVAGPIQTVGEKRSVELKLRISDQSWHLVDTVWNWGCVYVWSISVCFLVYIMWRPLSPLPPGLICRSRPT